MTEYLNTVRGNAEQEKEITNQIALVDQQISQQQIENSQRVLEQKERERQKEIDLRNVYASSIASLDDEILKLNIQLGNSAELSKADEIAKQLQTEAYKNLTPEIRAAITAKAQEIDQLKAAAKAQEEYRKEFDKTANIFEDALTKIVNGDFKGLLNGLLDQLKKFLIRAAAEWLASKFFKLLNPSGGNSSGSGFGGIFDTLKTFSISAATVQSPPRRPLIPIHRIRRTWHRVGVNAQQQMQSVGGGSSGGGSHLAGTLGLVGAGAGILGGLLGGRVGGLISTTGTGLALGAQIGSIIPGVGTVVGAVVGAVGGFLAGLFGGDPKKKRDKKENLPQLHKGFTEAIEQLRALAADKNAFYENPDAVIQKAMEIRQQIAGGFGVQFLSNKYKKQSKNEIAAKLKEADVIIEQMKAQKDNAKVATDIDQRLETSFATGVYMDRAFLRQYGDFKRRNGMLAGQFTDRDTLPSMLATGEMVLNPVQIGAVIRNAGGADVFKGAGIPNYATGVYLPPSPSVAPSSAAVSSVSANEKQPIIIQLTVNSSGIVKTDVTDIMVDGLKNNAGAARQDDQQSHRRKYWKMRPESADLTKILKSYVKRETLDLYLNDETMLHLSRGKVSRDGIEYQNYIRSVGDLTTSIGAEVDRIDVYCQNVNSELGLSLASDLRLLDYAVANYGTIRQSLRNPALIEDNPRVLPGVLANAEADEQTVKFELIVDYTSLGAIFAARNLSPKCSTVFKNGIECTTTEIGTYCPKTLLACKKYDKPWENMGWTYFEEPVNSPPGTGTGIGIGGCFALDTKIWLPSGDIEIEDLPVGKLRQPILVVSFDSRTGIINYADEIIEVFEGELTGYFTFEFEHGTVSVTPRHRFFKEINVFEAADHFRIGGATRIFTNQWIDSKLLKIRWHSDKKLTVRNVRVKTNNTFFANRCAVHNAKHLNPDLS